tara:strand:+ start:425 stop:1255 length:831 start_codon:yes stop_codon:yes gene_type:complete
MAVVLDGTLGVTTPAESVTGTGVWSVGGSQIYKDASGNVGIGTSAPNGKLDVKTAADSKLIFNEGSTAGNIRLEAVNLTYSAYKPLELNGSVQIFATGGTERARIDSSGNLLLRTTSYFGGVLSIGTSAADCIVTRPATNIIYSAIAFQNSSASFVGYISVSGSGTAYNTLSDYRLKNTIAPMTGALDKVALLKPCTYKWNADGSDGQGFIAHELAEVEPGCVSGAKDAVDAEGKPQFQGIDTGFLVATLTAAIQELKAIVDAQATRITALEGAAA